MIAYRKDLLAAVVVLVCAGAMAVGQEPNDIMTGIRFDSNDNEQGWLIDIHRNGTPVYESREQMIRGSFRPRYVAVFYVARKLWDKFGNPDPDFSQPTRIESVLSTSAGKSFSQDQVDLLHTGASIRVLGQFGDAVGNHQHVRIYAVSEKDARQTVAAYIEILTKASKNVEYLKHQLQELHQNIPETKKEISEKEASLKSVRTRLDELKKSVHYLSVDEAKQTALELNKTLNALEVEIAGLQAKIATIEKYTSDKKVGPETVAKLEAMLSQESVELAGALARKQAATRVRNQAAQLCELNGQETDLVKELKALEGDLLNYKMTLALVQSELASPPQVKLFQDKVTIYPVRAD
jgi:phage shock protein A